MSKGRGKVRLYTPHQGQDKIQDKILESDAMYHTIVTGRRFGKTMMCMNLILYWGLKYPKRKIAWMTPYQNQARNVYEDLVLHAQNVIKSQNGQLGKIWLNSGTIIEFVSLENFKAIRGSGYSFVVIDEAAFVRPEAINVVRPTFYPLGQKIILISTPWTKSGFFYDYYQLGLDPDEPDYESYHAKTMDNPLIPDNFIEHERLTMPEDMIRVEYLAEFRSDGGDVFTDFIKYASINQYKGSYAKDCYLGVDIALGGKDLTCCVILDELGKVIYCERWRESNTQVQIDKISRLFDVYNIKRCNIEINQERGIYQNLSKKFGKKVVKDWYTTGKNKPEMIQNLKKDIEDGIMTLPSRNLDPIFVSEMEIFSSEAKPNGTVMYSAPPGAHDDTVIALALANEARVPKRYGKKFII